MKKISRKRFNWLKEQHWRLWDWLAKNPSSYTDDWAGFRRLGERIYKFCFACQFVKDLSISDNLVGCEYCPLGKDEIGCDNGLLHNWVWARYDTFMGASRRVNLAKQIRDLPWSEEYVEENNE